MKNRNGGDSSFVLGLVLGIAVGAAIVFILTAEPKELSSGVQQAKESLESGTNEAKARVEGAAEGVAQ